MMASGKSAKKTPHPGARGDPSAGPAVGHHRRGGGRRWRWPAGIFWVVYSKTQEKNEAAEALAALGAVGEQPRPVDGDPGHLCRRQHPGDRGDPGQLRRLQGRHPHHRRSAGGLQPVPAGRRAARRHLGQLQRHRLRDRGAQREHGAHPRARRRLDHLQPGHDLPRRPDHPAGPGRECSRSRRCRRIRGWIPRCRCRPGRISSRWIRRPTHGCSNSSPRCGRTAGCTRRPAPPASSPTSTRPTRRPSTRLRPAPDAIPM